jgi:glutamyl-tRNA synthetase
MNQHVRVRFAPSPTGGLHLGGVRTVLYNYLFAKHHNGKFIVRIEDTDQTRFVEGAEAYIFKTLEWCGLQPDESPLHSGPFEPYRQSERKPSYKKYAEELVAKGLAYYAFDTAEELENKRKEIPNFQYGHATRTSLKNSLTLSQQETQALLDSNTPHVIRIKVEPNQEIKFTDLIRGEVHFDTTQIDDKVLLKADEMPTYHLAVVVDDYLMKISHAFRGEEWLPSAPVHILLWQHLFGLENMPQWAHLPLILKPDGHGKLSKRDGDRLGFPVFAMDWIDPKTNEINQGFKEKGFLPQAFVNMLAMLGWNAGSEKEIFSLNELTEIFSLERVHKAGAKFDFEKAKWFNHEWIKKLDAESLIVDVKKQLLTKNIVVEDESKLKTIINLVKDRCTLLTDFIEQCQYFYVRPTNIDISAIQPKWDNKKTTFFEQIILQWQQNFSTNAIELEQEFKSLALTHEIKVGELMMPLRLMLVGGKFGPGVFDIATVLGKAETIARIENVLTLLYK